MRDLQRGSAGSQSITFIQVRLSLILSGYKMLTYKIDWNVWSQFVVRNARGIWKTIDIDEFFRLKVSNKLLNSTHSAPPTLLKSL